MLPNNVTIQPDGKTLRHAHGHILHPVSTYEDIKKARAIFVAFTDGSYEIVGGDSLDHDLAGLSLTPQYLGHLAEKMTRRRIPCPVLVQDAAVVPLESTLTMTAFLQRVGAPRVASHVFGVQVGVHVRYLRCGGAPAAAAPKQGSFVLSPADPSLNPRTWDTRDLLVRLGVDGARASCTLPAQYGRMVLEFPLGMTWEQVALEITKTVDHYEKDEVREVVDAALLRTIAVAKKYRAYPVYFVTLDLVNGSWKLATPTTYQKNIGFDSATPRAGIAYDAPAFDTSTGLIDCSPIPCVLTQVDRDAYQTVDTIGSFPLRSQTGGVARFDPSVTPVSVSLTEYFDMLNATYTDVDAPAVLERPLIDGMPASDAQYTTILLSQSRVPQSGRTVRLPRSQCYGFGVYQFAFWFGYELNNDASSPADFTAIDPYQFCLARQPNALKRWVDAALDNDQFKGGNVQLLSPAQLVATLDTV